MFVYVLEYFYVFILERCLTYSLKGYSPSVGLTVQKE